MNGPHDMRDVIGGRYEIEGFLGEGGMQYVYLALDKVLNRSVALKTPKNPSAEKRFHRSATVSAKINHPNVAKTLDYLEVDEKLYLIEELILGDDLEAAIINKTACLDPFLVARLFHFLAKGLAASHHAGVVHRDLKPTNIMIEGGLELDAIKITDFGIAKMAEEEITDAAEAGAMTMSHNATVVGAIPYMAPEAINTPREVGLKADIWSLGAMMYELLAGEKPFGVGLKAIGAIINADIPAFPPFVTSKPQFKALSESIIKLILQCMKKNPDDRPSADELVLSCGDLCYPVSPRRLGVIREFKYNAFGHIDEDTGERVFYHNSAVYGSSLPQVGDRVMFSKFEGGGSDRALPVVALK